MTLKKGRSLGIDQGLSIAYIIGQLTLGGTESQLLELVRHLNHNKFKILVVCLSRQAPLASSFVEAGCEVRILNREERGRLLIFWDLYHLLRMFRPDIVHSYDYASRAAIPISKIFSRYKNIVSIRKQPGWQYSWWDQVLNSFADCILTNSHKAVESLRLGLQQNVPCQVIYNGIDLQKFDEEANRGFDFELPVDPGSRVICVVARLHPVKGLDILLNAFTKISRAMDNVQLWIVGDGPEMEKLKQQTDRLGIGSKVVFWGQKKNIPSILKQAEIGVLSSHVEGLPNAIIEYMAAKLPVVATNVGGIPELITHNTNGLLVEPNNPDELAMAILTLLNDPRLAEKFGENGRLFVEQNLDLKCMVSKVETIYEILCSKQ